MGGSNNWRVGDWVQYILIVAFIIWAFVVWWFTFLPAIGEIANSGVSDPSAVQWYLLSLALLAGLLLIIVFILELLKANTGGLIYNTWMWFFLQATFFFTVWTIWAFLWDSRFSGLFPGGVPVVPSPYDADQMAAYIFWQTLLIFVTVYISLLVVVFLIGVVMVALRMLFKKPEKEAIGQKMNNKNIQRRGSRRGN